MTSASEAPAPAAARPSAGVIALALALLMGCQPIATDLYLPALPAIRADFGGAMGAAQLTLSALMLAFGLSQLFIGPLSDRFGRRPVLLGGLAGYVVACVGSAAAMRIETLVACRVLQGFGMAAAVVCARAMVRDLFEPHEGARVMSQALGGVGAIALVSPIVGGLMADALGWRATMVCGAVFAAVTLAFVAWRLPETVRERQPHALAPARMLATWGRIARHPSFIAWCTLVACSYGGIYTYLAGSAFVFIDKLGLPRWVYGLLLSTMSAAYITGTVACRRWLPRLGLAGTVRRGAAFSLAGGTGLMAFAVAGVHTPCAILLPQLLFAFGHGIHQPCGQAAVTGPFPAQAGAASALAGFVLALVAFVISGWLGVAMNGTVYPMVGTVGVFALLTAATGWTLVQRHGEGAAAVSAR